MVRIKPVGTKRAVDLVLKLAPQGQALELELDNSEYSNHSENVRSGYSNCSRCSCPGFVGGSGVYTCQRSGCGHHYDEHW
jgi:hypothetical protein